MGPQPETGNSQAEGGRGGEELNHTRGLFRLAVVGVRVSVRCPVWDLCGVLGRGIVVWHPRHIHTHPPTPPHTVSLIMEAAGQQTLMSAHERKLAGPLHGQGTSCPGSIRTCSLSGLWFWPLRRKGEQRGREGLCLLTRNARAGQGLPYCPGPGPARCPFRLVSLAFACSKMGCHYRRGTSEPELDP